MTISNTVDCDIELNENAILRQEIINVRKENLDLIVERNDLADLVNKLVESKNKYKKLYKDVMDSNGIL